ncbi:M16 family metallopeptidase [Rhodalgimonas zhirmunskyi]|uniref:Insulinase family protein n=1 Tax=Rhodalgimonas zhirmunskyi TaxID=2964767 RepID=A0AAJ1UAM0_9RHOB|nr:pitrilysin family protein [Rhodoalgimonas zhirmunskyi]MDQ2094378.1 insulinase family protein [Rhodoalgimonas zhirmunskyi]
MKMTAFTRVLTAGVVALGFALPAAAKVDVQEITSPGGINVWLVEEHSIPFTALEIRFKGGASLDAPGKRGAINLMTGLLEEGTGDMDARDFTRATESLAASFRYSSSDDAISISAKFLTENRDQAIALLRDSIVAPAFNDNAIERVRGQVLSNIRSDVNDPNAMAGRAMAEMLYGDHPYGSDESGTIESVTALTRDDLVAAHKAAMARDRLYVSAVGDITPDELGRIVDTLFADLPAKGAPMPDKVTPRFDGGTHVTDFDTPQSVVRFGQPGLALEDPDFFAAYLLNVTLGGGGFESRLMQEVREKRGLTYGVYSYLADRALSQAWVGSVASANDRVAEAMSVIKDEWTKMHETGVTPEELQDAKTYLTGEYPLRFDGNGPIARIMANMQMMDMPVDYINTRNDKIEAVTLDDVNRVARERMDPDKLTFVVVGRPQGLSN